MSNTNAKAKTQRDTNIDLLKIFCMGGIVVLHFNNPLYGGRFNKRMESTKVFCLFSRLYLFAVLTVSFYAQDIICA